MRPLDPNLIILAFSAVVIAAYVLDMACRKVKLPSVILLLLSGMALRQLFDRLGWSLPYVDEVLPVLGTLGLVLIVLDGALDLELRQEKKRLVALTLAASAIGFALSLGAIAIALHQIFATDWTRAFLTACPFAVISSAVAIPSVASLAQSRAEFVVYESSLSDIIGVMVFYALVAAEGDLGEFALTLGVAGMVSLALGLVFTAVLYVLLNRLTGHVKYLPIFFALMLLYALGKFFHLSPLMLVLAFGLLLNNAFLLARFAWLKRYQSETFEADLGHFKQIVMEGAFFVRTYFFLLLGFSTDLLDFVSPTAWLVTATVIASIYLTRWPLLRMLSPNDVNPLLWVAPRGLVTVVLFLSLPPELSIERFPVGAVMLVVLLTALFLSGGVRAAVPPGAVATPGPQRAGEP